jgi:hypothetical protein
VAEFRKYIIQFPCSINCNFFDQLSDYQFLEEDNAPRTSERI